MSSKDFNWNVTAEVLEELRQIAYAKYGDRSNDTVARMLGMTSSAVYNWAKQISRGSCVTASIRSEERIRWCLEAEEGRIEAEKKRIAVVEQRDAIERQHIAEAIEQHTKDMLQPEYWVKTGKNAELLEQMRETIAKAIEIKRQNTMVMQLAMDNIVSDLGPAQATIMFRSSIVRKGGC